MELQTLDSKRINCGHRTFCCTTAQILSSIAHFSQICLCIQMDLLTGYPQVFFELHVELPLHGSPSICKNVL
ncbi:hypothetical protein ANCCAN_25998 [Ancylostoma caninum]|uniref:Uncharacterized protein n=1 Tax=Ancylostoma caninum TaxID=29170 RepID=A0A368F9I6_ANCCA|nr:hypothetical protein ANCCAN_25998 [Ancylostoma caninum]